MGSEMCIRDSVGIVFVLPASLIDGDLVEELVLAEHALEPLVDRNLLGLLGDIAKLWIRLELGESGVILFSSSSALLSSCLLFLG